MKSPRWQFLMVFIGAILVSFLCFALLFVEIRALSSGLAGLYENPLAQTFRFLFRILAFVLILTTAVLGIATLWKKGALITVFLFACYGAFFIAAISFFFYEWYVSLPLLLGILLILAPESILLFYHRVYKGKEED